MPIHPETGLWQPDLCAKQVEIMNCYKKFLLVSGPVKSTKTTGCLNKVLRHAWETPMARIGIFARTTKSAFAGGVWSDLIETVLPSWTEANMGMQIRTGKKNAPEYLIDGQTRLCYLDVTNMHGNKSRIQLHSLDFDWDVEASLKSGRFSMFYFSELSNFKDRIVFDTSTERLRMPHLRAEQHQWIADTNPDDSGQKCWIWKLFYADRLAENHPFPDQQAKYHVIECTLDDNPWLSQDERNEIFARYAHDEDRRNRYCYGKWTTRTEKGLFSEVFMSDTHVLGNTSAFNEEDWQVLLPSETCSKLPTGWDIGASKNHSVHILEKLGADGDPKSVFHVLDEVISLGTMLTVEDFTSLVVERMDFWEKYIREHCHPNPVEWRHWSDTSAFNTFRAALGGYDHTVVAIASEGRIMLMAAPKSPGSIFKRTDLLRRLLFQGRLFVSARCVQTIEMLGSLKAGKTKMDPVEDCPMTHVFDSLTYSLASELVNELASSWSPDIGKTSGLVSVKL